MNQSLTREHGSKFPELNHDESFLKAQDMKSRKRKKDDPKQPNLVSFMSKNKKSTTIISDINDLPNMINDLRDTCEKELTHALLFATNTDMKQIFIIILLVSEKSLPVKERPEDSIYVRARVNQGSYVGRVMMLSKNLQDLKASVKLAREKIKGFPGYEILSKKLLLACTKPLDVVKVDSSDARETFLRKQLNDSVSRYHEDEKFDDLQHDKVEEIELDDDFQVIHNDEQSNMINEKSLVSIGNMSSMSVMGDLDANDNTVNMRELAKNDDFHVYISSTEETEPESESQPKTKKRRIHDFTNPKLIARLREQRKKSAEETETNIVRTIEKLKEIMPTLSANESSTIAMKALFTLTMELNNKINNSKEEKSFAARIPLTRNITLKKISSTGQIKLGDRVTLPLKGYSKAILAEKPCLIVSRFIRYCFDSSLKVGCEINDKHDDSNFLFRLGSENLIGEARVMDGREIMDIIIEHAHRLKNLDSMSCDSLNACWSQVKKAIYDCSRREGEKKSHDKQDKQVNMDNDAKNEPESFASKLPNSVLFM